jgi:hypothetical protein
VLLHQRSHKNHQLWRKSVDTKTLVNHMKLSWIRMCIGSEEGGSSGGNSLGYLGVGKGVGVTKFGLPFCHWQEAIPSPVISNKYLNIHQKFDIATPKCIWLLLMYICILLAWDFGCQTYTFQHGTLGTVIFYPNMAQSSHVHAWMCMIGNQNLMPKVCEYIKSCQTCVCYAVKLHQCYNILCNSNRKCTDLISKDHESINKSLYKNLF